MSDWPFDQEKNVAAITSRNVLEENYPILLVIHYEDDHSWAFLCGEELKTEDGRVIGMGEALEIDPTLESVSTIEPGYYAKREEVGSPWKVFKSEEE